MRRFRAIALSAAAILVAGSAQPDVPLPALVNVLGNVTNAAQPVANALVIALDLTTFSATQTYTRPDGSFALPQLRNGIYRIIAVKTGFVPAITTVVPTKPDHRVNLRLQNEKATTRSANQEIWELRGSLPDDILRELDAVLAPPAQVIAAYELPRFRGEVVSMTGVAKESAAATFAQTELGVQSRIGDSWQVGIRGNVHRVDDPTDGERFGDSIAESSAMSMEVRSSPSDSYRLASMKSSWRYRDSDTPEAPRAADVRSHNFEWKHGAARVQVRYFAQQNLFETNSPDSDLIEIAGDTTVMQTRNGDIGVSLRVTQESVGKVSSEILRTADIAANATYAVGPTFIVHYGMASRVALDGTEWAPRTGAEWKISNETALIASAMYKVWDGSRNTTLPSIVLTNDVNRVIPRYAYSFGVISGDNSSNRISAIATVSAVDSPLRLVFTDTDDQFWDGLQVESGDQRRDLRVSYRHEFGSTFAVDVATSAGTAIQEDVFAGRAEKQYVTGDLQSTFNPTRTSFLISYREIEQPSQIGHDDKYKSERVNLRMLQSLYLPIDVRLLLGLEVVRAENSPYLVDTLMPEGTSKKYIGGLALNF